MSLEWNGKVFTTEEELKDVLAEEENNNFDRSLQQAKQCHDRPSQQDLLDAEQALILQLRISGEDVVIE
jgi:hypothetical protein